MGEHRSQVLSLQGKTLDAKGISETTGEDSPSPAITTLHDTKQAMHIR